VVLGVSPDSARSHRKFKEKYALPFTLVADEDHAIADAYGVWGEKSMFGLTFHGTKRVTFVIDAAGRVAKVIAGVDAKEHPAEAAAALEELR
jgi:thioredoxin-dependent peroxiredoxin